ncbi:MAG: hypothetical protein AAF682_09000 [Planctomycetota bacterium]
MPLRALLTALGGALLASSAAAQDVGDRLAAGEAALAGLSGFTGAGAETWTDLQGRVVLIEFFAHW